MIYQHLLYSRSLMQDYRWITTPGYLTEADLNVLRDVYYLYDDFKRMPEYLQAGQNPIYCLRFTNASVLVECKETQHNDQFGRPIYCLQGICVADAYLRHFWFALPWLLTEFRGVLDIWGRLAYRAADSMNQTVMEDSVFDMGQLSAYPADKDPFSGEISPGTTVSFDEAGFGQLVQLMAGASQPSVQFAFGILPGMDSVFRAYDILGMIPSRAGAQPVQMAQPREAQITPPPRPTASPEASPTRPSAPTKPDRMDRFDPVKAREDARKSEEEPPPVPKTVTFNPFDIAQRILAAILGGNDTSNKR